MSLLNIVQKPMGILNALLARGTEQQQIVELTDSDRSIIQTVGNRTLTSLQRKWGLLQAVRYVSARKIPGDFVELGVWKGGSTMIAALEFARLNDVRPLWLYDTYEGMPAPEDVDRKSLTGAPAADKWEQTRKGDGSNWCKAALDVVKSNMASVNYPGDIRYVVGKAEETLASEKPEQVSILRIDTDWHASTKASLEHLWDRLSPGGVLIMDDYGSWNGAKVAADDFFATREPIFMHYLDDTGRLVLKV